MMTELETYLHRGRRTLKRLMTEPRVRTGAEAAGCAVSGLLMSAASLGNAAMPLAMGLICAVTGWRTLVMGLGSAAGYWLFWGESGLQGMVWAALGCLMALCMEKRQSVRETPLLISAVAAFGVSFTGLIFQMVWGDTTPVPIYLLRVAAGAAGAALFTQAALEKSPMAQWLAQAVGVLALAQVVPIPLLGLGFLAGGVIAVREEFPAVALAGLALDLAQVTSTPMTAVLTLVYFTRQLPVGEKWIRYASPGMAYLLVMGLTGSLDGAPLLGLTLGGALAVALPPKPEAEYRRGETGMAQVRLELMAGVLSETQQLLLEAETIPIDEDALLHRTRERACGSCPSRKICQDVVIPEDMLSRHLTDTTSLPFPCRKPGRMILELRRSQEQLRSLRGERDKRREFREAVIQQYRFLSEYLRQTADALPRRGKFTRQRFQPEAAVCSTGKESANGDRCAWFAGTESRYYIVLCDGMGTGLGASVEGKSAMNLLRRMLTAGFPAEYALRSLNSIMTLRGRAGAATVDLAEIDLVSGAAAVYKWGAAPSWLLRGKNTEKIGTASPPPGISVADTRETVDRLSLRRGEALILCSDGVDAEGILRRGGLSPEAPPGELAAYLLEQGGADSGDDATCAVVRLHPAPLST